jgi:hypothetical protein
LEPVDRSSSNKDGDMSSQNNDGQVFLAFAMVVVLVLGFCILKFSEALGLDFMTGGKVLGGLVMATVLLGVCWWQAGFGFGLRGTWPICAGVAWMALWPALNVWGVVIPAMRGYEPELAWWAMWYTKVLGLAAVVGLGYLVNRIIDDY